MNLVLDARFHRKNSFEPVRLKYWENNWLTLRTIRDTPIGEIEVGAPWECPFWLFEQVYEPLRAQQPSSPREE